MILSLTIIVATLQPTLQTITPEEMCLFLDNRMMVIQYNHPEKFKISAIDVLLDENYEEEKK